LDSERRSLANAMVAAVAAEYRGAGAGTPASTSSVPVGPPPTGPVAAGVESKSQRTDDTMPSPSADAPGSGAGRLGTPDASPPTVQNLLFVLGGVLLGVGAIVFTVFAWARYGVAGRVTVLGAATLLAFVIPAVAKRRGLVATAETVAAIALLLVLLDGYG